MKRVLLHICCGICASGTIEKLKSYGFAVTGYFYNPNIHPEEEFQRRLAVCEEVARLCGIPLLTGAYDQKAWFSEVTGLEQEPEGGKRCEVCFRMRIRESWKKAQDMGIFALASTLSISPHKDSAMINRIGKTECGLSFLEYDFKKQDGWKIANAFAKEHSLYRQHYCGCTFSRKPGQD